MAKTLNFDSFFKTQVEVNVRISISQLFAHNTSFFIRLHNNAWVLYCYERKELIKGKNLEDLLSKTLKVSLDTFYAYAVELSSSEKEMVHAVFLCNDNYNLNTLRMYKL